MMGLGMRFRALVAAVGLLLMAVTVNAVADSKVNSVRLWRAPDNTRLVFDLSGPVQHSVFTLTAPDRLVIDINGATLGAPLKLQTANTPITAMRSAQRTPTDLRVVIDLKKAVTPKSFSLAPNGQYGNRLVVDLFDNAADAEPAPTPAPTPSVAPDTGSAGHPDRTGDQVTASPGRQARHYCGDRRRPRWRRPGCVRLARSA